MLVLAQSLEKPCSADLIVEAAPHAMVLTDAAGRIVLVNGQAEKLLGYDRADLLGQPADLSAICRDGIEIPVEIALSTIETAEGTFTLATVVDVTDRTIMLKEAHHRIKNNLQVICSLLSMQIACTEDSAVGGQLNDAHSRVLSMALIHEQIYQSNTVSELDFGKYVDVLSQRLFFTYCVDSTRIQLELSIEPLHLDMHRAIPCGLILNELISNALKYAFPGGRSGVVQITLRRAADGRSELEVADNGIGLPADLNWETTHSLGMQVVRTLMKQLRATFSVSTGSTGTTFLLRWTL